MLVFLLSVACRLEDGHVPTFRLPPYSRVAKQPFINSCFLNNHSCCKGPSLERIVVWGTTVYEGLLGFPRYVGSHYMILYCCIFYYIIL